MAKIKDRVKELRWVKASELLAHPQNWREHPPAQQEAMKGVLEEIGFANAVIARETPDGLQLIDGHLRQDVMPESQKIPVLIVDVTEEEANQLLVTLDPLAGMAETNQALLHELLEEVSFESEAVNDLLDSLVIREEDDDGPGGGGEDPGAQIDKADELQKKWKVKRGDLFTIGNHRLLCGDATSEEDVARLMGGEKSKCAVTDPPYGVAYTGGTTPRNALKGDETPDLYGPALALIAAHSDGKCPVYLWHSDSKSAAVTAAVTAAVEAAGYERRCTVIWNKNQAQFGALGAQYKTKHEPCLYIYKKGESPRWFGPTNEVTVWDEDRNAKNDHHPTEKPVAVMARPLRNSSEAGDVVLDPFLGSGTTMVAAEQLKRKCYGLEIEPKYCAVTLERMKGMGLKPKALK